MNTIKLTLTSPPGTCKGHLLEIIDKLLTSHGFKCRNIGPDVEWAEYSLLIEANDRLIYQVIDDLNPPEPASYGSPEGLLAAKLACIEEITNRDFNIMELI